MSFPAARAARAMSDERQPPNASTPLQGDDQPTAMTAEKQSPSPVQLHTSAAETGAAHASYATPAPAASSANLARPNSTFRISKDDLKLLLTAFHELVPGQTPDSSMGISLWSADGYLLGITTVNRPPFSGKKCDHSVRQLVLSNSRRTQGTTLCCSRIFFCTVCMKFAINAGVRVIQFGTCMNASTWTSQDWSTYLLGTGAKLNVSTFDKLSVFDVLEKFVPEGEKQMQVDTLRMFATAPTRLAFHSLSERSLALLKSFSSLLGEFGNATWKSLPESPTETPPSVHSFFMICSLLLMLRSEDRNGVRVGCVLVDAKKLDGRDVYSVIGIGYNAYHKNLDPSNLHANAAEILHAEQNAILFRTDVSKPTNLIVYSTRFPCDECSSLFVATLKPSRVVFWEVPWKDERKELKYPYKLGADQPLTYLVGAPKILEEHFGPLTKRDENGRPTLFFHDQGDPTELLRTARKNSSL